MKHPWGNPRKTACLLLAIILLFPAGGLALESETFSIADLIFQNECSRREACLLSWNVGENFPSLGIAHFIWYPKKFKGPFDESFPKLLRFMETKGIELPEWFHTLPGRHAPWKKRGDFLRAVENGELEFLRDFLIQTREIQAEFIVDRFMKSIPLILQDAPKESRTEIGKKLLLLIRSGRGLYPLVDYVNFNGEGLLKTERYKGHGWGLLQVLQEMKMPSSEAGAVLEFVIAAEIILKRRVDKAPRKKNIARWLPGWQNRIRTYLSAQTDFDLPLSIDNLPSVMTEISTTEANSLNGEIQTGSAV